MKMLLSAFTVAWALALAAPPILQAQAGVTDGAQFSSVQFYPTLMEVAQRMGTVKPTYDPNHKVAP